MPIEDYPLPGNEIEYSVREGYGKALSEIIKNRNYGNPLEAILASITMIDCLGKSSPRRGDYIIWSAEIIEAYRIAGKVLKEILEGFQIELHMGYSNAEEMKEQSDSLKKGIEELRTGYSGLIDQFDGENYIEKVINTLNHFQGINQVLEDYNIGDADELREKIEYSKQVEEDIDKIEDKIWEVERRF